MFQHRLLLAATLVAVLACKSEPGATGPKGSDGTNGRDALVRADDEAAGANCAAGGVKLAFGIDANGDGKLGDAEVDATRTRYVCNGPRGADGTSGTRGTDGANGLAMLVRSDAEAAGPHCATGGIRLSFGLDRDASGVLEDPEITADLTQYVCHGANGQQGLQGLKGDEGRQGAAGLNALVVTSPEPVGTNCSSGGTRLQTGLDQNGNGLLDPLEVDIAKTSYVCNGPQGAIGPQGGVGPAGSNGRNGYTTLVVTSTESAGSNCATGGIKVVSGIDLDGNGSLSSVELAAANTSYVCNGAPGTFSGTFSGAANFTGAVTMASLPAVGSKDLFNALMAGTTPAILGNGVWCTDGSSAGPPATLATSGYAYGETLYTADGDVTLDLAPPGTGSCTNVCAHPLTYFLNVPAATTISVSSYLDDNGGIYVNGALYKKTGGSSGAASVALPAGSVALTLLACSNNGASLLLQTTSRFVVGNGLAIDFDRHFHRNGK